MVRWKRLVHLLWLTVAGSACLPAARLELSGQQERFSNPGPGLWWSIDDPRGVHGPILAVEQPVGPGQVRQWVIDRQGVRVFYYNRRESRAGSVPLVTEPMGGEFDLVVSLVRSRFGDPDEPGWPGGPLPAEEVNALSGPGDLIDLLNRHWPAARVDPPGEMTHHEIREAVTTGNLTLFDLLESGL